MPGFCNGINVLPKSPLMTRIEMCQGSPGEFEASSHKYNYNYYLANGIYLKWCTSVKPVVKPQGKKQLDFHNAQATARKDVERVFEICKLNFLTRDFFLHSVITKNERDQDLDYSFYDLMGRPVCVQGREERIARFLSSYHSIRDSDVHNNLQTDLIEEWWKWNGQQSP
jgi:hypothetical protein